MSLPEQRKFKGTCGITEECRDKFNFVRLSSDAMRTTTKPRPVLVLIPSIKQKQQIVSYSTPWVINQFFEKFIKVIQYTVRNCRSYLSCTSYCTRYSLMTEFMKVHHQFNIYILWCNLATPPDLAVICLHKYDPWITLSVPLSTVLVFTFLSIDLQQTAPVPFTVSCSL